MFDLKSGTIFLFRFPGQDDAVELNLAEELKKAAHFYDIPEIRGQVTQELRALTDGMKKN